MKQTKTTLRYPSALLFFCILSTHASQDPQKLASTEQKEQSVATPKEELKPLVILMKPSPQSTAADLASARQKIEQSQNKARAHIAQLDQQLQAFTMAHRIAQALEAFEENIKKFPGMIEKTYEEWCRAEMRGLQSAYPNIENFLLKQEAVRLAHEWSNFPYIGPQPYRWACWPYGRDQMPQELPSWTKYWYLAVHTTVLKLQVPASAQSALACVHEASVCYAALHYCWQHPAGKKPRRRPNTARLLQSNTLKVRLYITHFQQGLQAYRVHKGDEDCDWLFNEYNTHPYGIYGWWIERELEGLAAAYPKLKSETERAKAKGIAFSLATLYGFEKFDFLFHYFSIQNRLMELNLSAGAKTKNDIVYSPIIGFDLTKE